MNSVKLIKHRSIDGIIQRGEAMGIKERQKRERDERRELILNAAGSIIKEEGIDSLSIRKIADQIEYSPGIIYHYFKDKDDILAQFIKSGYKKIMNAISSPPETDEPVQKLREMTNSYIKAALQMPDEYMAAQLNNSPGMLEHTASMFQGASIKKPALAILAQCLKDIYHGQDKDMDDDLAEMTAQVIAAASFGLIIKLIIEKELVSEEQKGKLIEHHIRFIVDGMILGKFPE